MAKNENTACSSSSCHHHHYWCSKCVARAAHKDNKNYDIAPPAQVIMLWSLEKINFQSLLSVYCERLAEGSSQQFWGVYTKSFPPNCTANLYPNLVFLYIFCSLERTGSSQVRLLQLGLKCNSKSFQEITWSHVWSTVTSVWSCASLSWTGRPCEGWYVAGQTDWTSGPSWQLTFLSNFN